MRELTEIIIHCADTRINQDFSIDDVRSWHIQRGFSDIGYHFYIKLDGSVWYGRDTYKPGAHCKGNNAHTIGVCFEGGLDVDGSKWDGPTPEQVYNYKELEIELFDKYGVLDVNPHSKYSTKSCPNFDIDILK